MMIFSFPDLVLILKDYLPSDDYFCLLSTSKALFQRVKRDHAYYSLTEEASTRFLMDEEFRLIVLRLVRDPCRQIALRIQDIDFNFAAYADHFYVHTVIFQHEPTSFIVPYLPHISNFDCWGMVDDIRHCSHLRSFSCALNNSITDISPLVNIAELEIHSAFGVTEDTLAFLGKQSKLILKSCPSLRSVENFCNIQQLELYGCQNITDISPLRGVRNLSIIRCSQISDISCLGNHYRLEISTCAFQLHGYHILRNIPIVHLSDCDISDLSVLQAAKEVAVWNCSNIMDVTALSNVRSVQLRSCFQINDISCLTGVRDLRISNLPRLASSIPLMNSGCQFTAGIVGSEVEAVKLYHAAQRLDIFFDDEAILSSLSTSFPYLKYLRISVYIPFSLHGLGSMHTVILWYCDKLTSLEGLGSNRYVEIKGCPLITDVSCLKKVPIVKIIECSGIKDYSCLREVPRLIIKY